MKTPLVCPTLVVALCLPGLQLRAQASHTPPQPGTAEHQRHYGDMGYRGQTQVYGRSYVINARGQLVPTLPPSPPPPLSPDQQVKSQAFLSSLPSSSIPDFVTLDAYQTPIRDQDQRGTCTAFASIAAVEAAYKRKSGLDLDLSEQYLFHLYKSTLWNPSLIRNGFHYENEASYWDNGFTPIVLGMMAQYRVPTEDGQPHATLSSLPYWPYTQVAGPVPIGNGTTYRFKYEMDKLLSDDTAAAGLAWTNDPATNHLTQANLDAWEYSPTYMPWQSGLDCRYGITSCTTLGYSGIDVSPILLQQTLASGREVVVSVGLFCKTVIVKDRNGNDVQAWDYDANLRADVDAGRRQHPGGHAMLLVGYDAINQIFFFKNSWGGTSYLRATWSFLANCLTDASVVNDVVDPNGPQVGERWLGQWNMDHDGWKGQLVVRRLPGATGMPVRLGTYIDGNGNRHDANGWLTDGGQGLVFFVAGGDQVTNAGDQVGQRFEAHTYSWEPSNAAGSTTWNNDAYGVFLSRDPIPGQYHAGFDRSMWVGSWAMDHDGWRGTLTIGQVYDVSYWTIHYTYFTATYTDGNGSTYSFFGFLNPDKPWQASFTINNQPYQVNFHTWESNVFSGTTVWNGTTFGVHGIKR